MIIKASVEMSAQSSDKQVSSSRIKMIFNRKCKDSHFEKKNVFDFRLFPFLSLVHFYTNTNSFDSLVMSSK